MSNALVVQALASIEDAVPAGLIISPQAAVFLDVAKRVVEKVESEAVSSLKDVANSFGSQIGTAIADLAGSVSDVVPFVGTLVKIVTISQSLYAAQAAAAHQWCDTFTRAAPHISTGAVVKPCDLFAQGELWPSGPLGTQDLRTWSASCALGVALIMMFEAAEEMGNAPNSDQLQYTGFEAAAHPNTPDALITFNAGAMTQQGAIESAHPWAPFQRTALYALYLKNGGPASKCGGDIPKELRLAIRDVRIAIASLGGVAGSDGGISLWPVYLDLLLSAMRATGMNGSWAAQLVNTSPLTFSPSSNTTLAQSNCDWSEAVVGVFNMLQAWNNTINPTQEPEISNQKAMIAQARAAIAKKAPLRLNFSSMLSASDWLRLASRRPYGFDTHISPAARVAIAMKELARIDAMHAQHALQAAHELSQAAARGKAQAAAKLAAKQAAAAATSKLLGV